MSTPWPVTINAMGTGIPSSHNTRTNPADTQLNRLISPDPCAIVPTRYPNAPDKSRTEWGYAGQTTSGRCEAVDEVRAITIVTGMQDLEQLAYERRVTDICSLVALLGLIIDQDPSARELTMPERISLAGQYAELWAKSRGYTREKEAEQGGG